MKDALVVVTWTPLAVHVVQEAAGAVQLALLCTSTGRLGAVWSNDGNTSVGE